MDHVIEFFRNQLRPDYKTGEAIDPDLLPVMESGSELMLVDFGLDGP